MPTRSGLFARVSGTSALSQTPAPVRVPPLRIAAPEPPRSVVRWLVLDNDPQRVAPLVALLADDLVAAGVCDRHAAGRVGIALEEALLNAIYHGNLEISSDLKEGGDEPFHALARERRTATSYSARRVRVAARVTPEKATFVIADEGPGFDVAALPDPTDPENLDKPSGRGLLLMRAFVDEVSYNATGNRVTLVKLRSASG